MTYGPPESPMWKRITLKALRIMLVLALYCWIGQAIYLWTGSGFYSDHGPWARVYLAGRDGFYDVPDTLLYVFGFVAQLISWMHGILVFELGYDPVALPDMKGFGTGAASGLTLNGIHTPSLSGASANAVYGLIAAGLGLSLLQFGALFASGAIGVAIGWRYPAVPKILDTSAGLIYLIATWAVAAWLVYSSFSVSIVSGLSGLVAALLLLWRPVVAGLPLWLLYVFGLRPRVIVLLPFMFMELLTRKTSASASASDRSERRGTGEARQEGERQQQGAGADHDGGLPLHGNADERVANACGTFGIPPEEFKAPEFPQRTLTSRFRELAKKLHGDTGGSDRLMAMLNSDYELLLSTKGWRR